MKKRTQTCGCSARSRWLGAATPHAQQSDQSQTPSTPIVATAATTASGQNGSDAQSAQPSDDSQTFSGTIVKSGDKYVLQDASKNDIDRQDGLKQRANRSALRARSTPTAR